MRHRYDFGNVICRLRKDLKPGCIARPTTYVAEKQCDPGSSDFNLRDRLESRQLSVAPCLPSRGLIQLSSTSGADRPTPSRATHASHAFYTSTDRRHAFGAECPSTVQLISYDLVVAKRLRRSPVARDPPPDSSSCHSNLSPPANRFPISAQRTSCVTM